MQTKIPTQQKVQHPYKNIVKTIWKLVKSYAQTLILLNLIVVTCLVSSTLLETVVFVFDHIWTQDSPMFSLTVGGKTGPYFDQGGSTHKV